MKEIIKTMIINNLKKLRATKSVNSIRIRISKHVKKFLKLNSPMVKKKNVAIKYYFILASDKFLLKDEPLEEVLRERVQHYQRVQKSIDFWLIQSPQFFTSEQLSDLRVSLSDTSKYSAIISTDESFITWLKLRFNNVAIGNFLAPTNDIPNPLGSYSTN